MQGVLPRTWKEEFERAAAMKREDLAHKDKVAHFEAKTRERRDDEREDKKEREEWTALEAAFAPAEDIAAFRMDLNDYNTRTVEALMDNQGAMDTVRRKMGDMLGEAHTLPDGRRVFKTMDGQHVFDEHGQELAQEVIDPASVDDQKPKWEAFKGLQGEGARLTEERQQLSDYQAKLDEARERLDSGEITNKELRELKADLAAGMPDSVRAKLEHDQPASAKLANINKPELGPVSV